MSVKSIPSASGDVKHLSTNPSQPPFIVTVFALSFIAAAAAATLANAATYSVSDTFIGTSFLSNFDHQAIADPTHRRVK